MRSPARIARSAIVLVCDRSAEEREDAVAGEVLHRSTERLDGVDHAPDGGAQELARILGIELLRELRRPDDVGEQGGDDLPLLAHLAAHRLIVLARSDGGKP